MAEHEKLTQELQSGLCREREIVPNFFLKLSSSLNCMKNEVPKI